MLHRWDQNTAQQLLYILFEIKIYTDGSCHPKALTGTWAAMLFIGDEKISLQGIAENTTHNRMELLAVINAIRHIDVMKLNEQRILIHSDSQYVVNLSSRINKLETNNFITKAGKQLQNSDLLQILIKQIKTHKIGFVKVKAHQKDGDVHNREVDSIARNLLRQNTN